MKNETKIAAAIYLLVEAGYTVSKGSALLERPTEPETPEMKEEKSIERVPSRGNAMSVEEFVFRYKVGRTVVFAEISSGRLATYKVGRRRYISEAAAQEWQEKLESGS